MDHVTINSLHQPYTKMKWDNFTAGRVKAFQCAEGKKQSIYWDGKTPGLGVRVTASGAKSYIFETSLNGKTLRITIGDVATYSIDDAQREAVAYKMQTNRGIDPRVVAAERIAGDAAKAVAIEANRLALAEIAALEHSKRELIARDVWDVYMAAPHPKWGDQHRADHAIAANPGGAEPKIGKKKTKPAPLAALLKLPLHSITAIRVQEWLEEECATRPTFAHNSYRKFRTFIRWCAKHPQYSAVVQADCCLADEVKEIVPANKTKDGDSLQREQLAGWFAAVRQLSNPIISAYLQGLLITGARRNELAMLQWADVEWNPNWSSITIRDKVDGKRTIPLPPYLMRLFAALPRTNKWVFSSPTSASEHITEPRIAHTQALKLAGLPHVSLHGLRRSFGTLAEWVEVPSGVVAQIQGHKPSALAEKHYRRRPLDLLRMWHVKIEEWMLGQAGIALTPAVPLLKAVA
ncbi:integrase family protein [Massilia sp. DJPM01]|uniref:tyrosine-type recombinase/integrase n=1 Tax=Massilia sp. DJPM01 TaxID=3024404 RepID=UPI00259E766D|nr:integrase family protein [Massilia sp. DJPM01]MDM5182007.1 integrase family protein [Massilia sp. DJPM01]